MSDPGVDPSSTVSGRAPDSGDGLQFALSLADSRTVAAVGSRRAWGGSPPSGRTVDEHLATVARGWPLLVALPLAFGVAIYLLLTVAGRSYTSSATLLVYPIASDFPGAPTDVEGAITLARSYGVLAHAPDVLAGAAFALGLPETAATLGPRVTSRAEPDTQLIVISVDDRDPARAAALANAVASSFIRWIGDRNAAAGADPVKVGLVGPAEVPLQVNGLPTLWAVTSGVGLGLVLAVLGALLLDRLDRRIWSAHDVRRVADLPIVARLARPRALWPRSRLITVREPLSRASDSFRSLWMRLGLTSSDDAVRAIVVTSAGPARAASAVAANLAISLAQAGQRVVLVDANLRQPRLSRLFKLSDRAGLADLLAGAGGWISDHLVDGPVPDLKLMLAGSLPRQEREQFAMRPLELATAVELLVTALHASGDLVVVDAPPLLDASEALVFAALATRLVIVVQEGWTRPAALAQAIEDVRASGRSGVSLVLADARW